MTAIVSSGTPSVSISMTFSTSETKRAVPSTSAGRLEDVVARADDRPALLVRARAAPVSAMPVERLVLVRLLLQRDRRPTSRTGSPSASRSASIFSKSSRVSSRTGSCDGLLPRSCRSPANRSATSARMARVVGLDRRRRRLARPLVGIRPRGRRQSRSRALLLLLGFVASLCDEAQQQRRRRLARQRGRPGHAGGEHARARPPRVASTEPRAAAAPAQPRGEPLDVRDRPRRRRASPPASRSTTLRRRRRRPRPGSARAPRRAAARARARRRPVDSLGRQAPGVDDAGRPVDGQLAARQPGAWRPRRRRRRSAARARA